MDRLRHWLRRVIWITCVMSLVLGTAGRLVIASRQRVLNHDEGITLIEATGHVNDLLYVLHKEQYPTNTWVEARVFKRYIEPEDSLIFGRIRSEMAQTDVTPPLYFWMAHVWFLLFGAQAPVGVALNVIISVATLALVCALAQRLFRNRLLALAVAAAWFVNPTATYTTFFIRHYQLFTFLAIAFAYVIYRFYYEPELFEFRVTHGIWLALAAAGGVLSNYMFIWVVAAGGGAVLLRYGVTQRRRVTLMVAWLSAGGVLFVIMHPDFRESLAIQQQRTHPDFSWDTMSQRAQAVIDQTTQFILDRNSFTDTRQIIVLAGMVGFALVMIGFALWQTWRINRWQAWRPERDRALFLGLLVVFNYGITALFYIVSLSPHVAMAHPWYMSVPWVFCVFVPVWLMDLPTVQRFKLPLLTLFVVGMFGAGVLTLSHQYNERVRANNPANYPGRDAQILIGSTGRGVLAPILINLPDHNRMFVATADDLLANPDAWLPQVKTQPTIYFAPSQSVMLFLQAEGLRLVEYPTFYRYRTLIILPLEDASNP